ncbi:hypothetical protein HMPREF9473_02071 [ [Hungatella hathewayi WAL-18680]|uniref:4-hydroxy-tetrahydrodipicolinate reductase n=1 Tax=Hungatella hathewayi WAL-18680 TaxID=742737 RepID=G5IEZ4_9FIRM|nr:hypothetical protein HMPREF9473_02071 [ [Hungatella hathewayi WAL-18680]
MVRMIMHGCNGAMGQVITGLVSQMEDIAIVAGIDMADNKQNEYPVFTSLEDCDVAADVIVDFASVKAVDHLLDYCAAKKLPVVVCTTGLSEEQTAKVAETAKEVAVLRSANMSLGVNLLLKLVAEAAKTLAAAGFDMEIVEKHHNQKVDAPSGTALALADSLNEAMGGEYHYQYDRSTKKEKRRQKRNRHPVRPRRLHCGRARCDIRGTGRGSDLQPHGVLQSHFRKRRHRGGQIPGREAGRSLQHVRCNWINVPP